MTRVLWRALPWEFPDISLLTTGLVGWLAALQGSAG